MKRIIKALSLLLGLCFLTGCTAGWGEPKHEPSDNMNRGNQRMRTFVRVISLIISVSMLSGCTGSISESASEQNEKAVTIFAAVLPENIFTGSADAFQESKAYEDLQEGIVASAQLRNDMDGFYVQILPMLMEPETGCVVCSPLNVYLALSVLAETSDGETRSQILDALNVPDMETLRARTTILWNANYRDDPLAQSLPASSIWLSNKGTYHDELLMRLARDNHVSSYQGKMGSEAMNQALRDWTDQNTKNMLSAYANGMQTNPEDVFHLVSTLYYKASWFQKFQPDETTREIFRGSEGDKECEMMHRSGPGMFYWGDGFSAIGLGLSDGAMYFFLPDEGTELIDVVQSAEAMDLIRNSTFYKNAEYLVVNASIPKFDVSSNMSLTGILTSMGITDATEPNKADFSPLTDQHPIALSGVDHAVRVSIDEEGITGAAFTHMSVLGYTPPKNQEVDFILDRPFYFVVTAQDRSVLFSGIIRDIS